MSCGSTPHAQYNELNMSTNNKPQAPLIRVELPPSKSMAARAMIINAVRGEAPAPASAKDCDDLRVLKTALRQLLEPQVSDPCDINLEASGTAARFLTAFCAATPGIYATLRGCERLQQRPMAPLIESLRALGAEIEPIGAPGYLPLRIRGRHLEGGAATIDAAFSSQFVSALLLVAPTMTRGLALRYSTPPPSKPYVRMTIDMMRQAGACVRQASDGIDVAAQPYAAPAPPVEADWSATSPFYEILALSPIGTEIEIPGLAAPETSLQGDARCAALFAPLGVSSHFTPEGTAILRRESTPDPAFFEADMNATPDLVPSLAMALALRGIHFKLKGIGHLRFKESDRTLVLSLALRRMLAGAEERLCDGEWELKPSPDVKFPGATPFNPVADHRMAMAIAPAALRIGQISISDADCVRKSFPGFFEQIAPLIPEASLTLHR